jgi:polysaccharide biosynthesis/export protein
MKTYQLAAMILAICFMPSCITSKKLTYLQFNGTASDTASAVQPPDYRIQPFDNLFIRVVTPDPQLSDMFNTIQQYSSGGYVSEQSADLISYAVDNEGNINLPYAGNFRVSGKTPAMVRLELEALLKSYVTDASVTVKMINNSISIIGEVRLPGRYQIYKNRMNIFQALAMAGDLNDFSNRQKIQVVRQLPGGSIVKEFSLADRSILASEFFYVMPNDVIYARPLRGKFVNTNVVPYTLTLSTITTVLLILNFLK